MCWCLINTMGEGFEKERAFSLSDIFMILLNTILDLFLYAQSHLHAQPTPPGPDTWLRISDGA